MNRLVVMSMIALLAAAPALATRFPMGIDKDEAVSFATDVLLWALVLTTSMASVGVGTATWRSLSPARGVAWLAVALGLLAPVPGLLTAVLQLDVMPATRVISVLLAVGAWVGVVWIDRGDPSRQAPTKWFIVTFVLLALPVVAVLVIALFFALVR